MVSIPAKAISMQWICLAGEVVLAQLINWVNTGKKPASLLLCFHSLTYSLLIAYMMGLYRPDGACMGVETI